MAQPTLSDRERVVPSSPMEVRSKAILTFQGVNIDDMKREQLIEVLWEMHTHLMMVEEARETNRAPDLSARAGAT